MTKEPLLSIIIPVYQVEKYIDTCLESLYKQTYRNIEIIIINDGSTDGSLKKCQAWQEKDHRILIETIQNHGVSHARNIGLDIAKGDIITFLDSDDWVEYDTYEILIREMIDSDADIVCGGFCQNTRNETKYILKKSKKKKLNAYNALCEMHALDFSDKIFGWELWDKIFKRDIIDGVRLDESTIIGEDHLFLWNVMKNVKSFRFIPQYGYHYRLNEAGAMCSMSAPKMFTYIMALRKINSDLHEYETEKGILTYRISIIYITNVVRLLKKIIKENELNLLHSLLYDCKEIIKKFDAEPLFNKSLTINVRLGYLMIYLLNCCRFI